MAVKETLQLFTPMLYVKDSIEAIAFYSDVFGVEEIKERTMLLSQVPGMENTPGADQQAVYSKLQFSDGSALSVAELNFEGATVGNNIHIGLQYTDTTAQKQAFDKLAEGGEVLEPWRRSSGAWSMASCATSTALSGNPTPTPHKTEREGVAGALNSPVLRPAAPFAAVAPRANRGPIAKGGPRVASFVGRLCLLRLTYPHTNRVVLTETAPRRRVSAPAW